MTLRPLSAQTTRPQSAALHRSGLVLTLLLLLILSASPSAYSQVADWKQIHIPPLPAFRPQQPTRIALPNGLVIFLQEDHELPLIDASLRIRAGSRTEPAEKVGLVTGGGLDSTSIAWSCLKQDFDDVFKAFLEVLQQPAFREDKLALAKYQADTSIARRNDSIDEIAHREATKLGYGPQSPYGRTEEYATIAAINRDDLVKWHQTYVHPNNMILGIVGDFDSKQMEARLRQVFGSWPAGPKAQDPPVPVHPAKPGFYLIPKTDVNQSIVRMVDLGTTRRNPDYYAIEVFNEAFGGGFSSRLFKNIRTKAGLAYSVGGGIGTAFDHPGLTRLGLGTKSKSTVEAIQGLDNEIDDLQKNPIGLDELNRAKDSILNSFVFNFDSPEKVLRERMAYEFYGYPADFLERYRAGVERVTVPDMARVAQKYLHKDRFAVLVVGNTSEFDKPLTALGPVQQIDISIPGSPPRGSPAAP